MTARSDNLVVVFGLTADGQPRAAVFPLAEEKIVRRAATALEYQVVALTTKGQANFARRLQSGQVFRTARFFAPTIRPKAYAELLKLMTLNLPGEASPQG